VNRHYNAGQGRFTQVDPIEMGAVSLDDPQSLNLYAYCENDPINHIDPDGLFLGKLFRAIGKAFKWAFRIAAVIVAVIAVIALSAIGQYWGSILITKGLVALLFASSGLLAVAGWVPGKIGQIAGALITAGLSWGSNFRTPNTFPSGTGVGGVEQYANSFYLNPRRRLARMLAKRLSKYYDDVLKPWVLRKARIVPKERLRRLGTDPKSGQYRHSEAVTATKLERRINRTIDRYKDDAYDWIDDAGRTYDAVGPVPSQFFDEKSFLGAIRSHLGTPGLDYTVIDTLGLTRSQIERIQIFYTTLSRADQAKIIILR
jgi:hypothetical protein